MAGRLLSVILMYFLSVMKAQALLPPTLTVNPPVITDTDSVTLNCQTPSSVSVSQCYFRIVRGGSAKSFSCLETLTGAELLRITDQRSPAQVKVTCFYLYVSQSPESDVSSIIIRTGPPTLTVNPPAIDETDSVTLNCQTPSSVSVSQCYFYTLSGGIVRVFSCLVTLTGSELLKMAHQSSSAEVKVICFYTEKELNSPSPHSDTSSITIHRQKPQMSLQHFVGDHVLFICSLPGSADPDTKCNLYFGEASRPVKTTTIWKEKASQTKQWFCRFTVTIDDLLSRVRLVQQSDASCDYSLGSESNSLSPRSDGYSLTDIVEKELSMTQTTPTVSMTTGGTVYAPGQTVSSSAPMTQTSGWTVGTQSNTGGSTSTSPTPVKPASETDSGATSVDPESGDEIPAERWTWRFVAVVAGCGATVGVILLLSAFFCSKRRTGSEDVKRCESQNEKCDTYHLYDTISEEPAATALRGAVYSTVQEH